MEPLAGFRSGLLSVRKGASGVEAVSVRVRGTVGFSSGLDPYDGVDEVVVGSVGGWAGTKAGTLDVAPVAPLVTDVLDTGTALVDDEVSVPAGAQELGSDGLDVVDLIVVRVALSDWVGGSSDKGVIVGDVGSQTTDIAASSSIGPDLGEHLGGR